MLMLVLKTVNNIQPLSGHFKVLRPDQDVQDVRGPEVQGAVLPHLQEPLVTKTHVSEIMGVTNSASEETLKKISSFQS